MISSIAEKFAKGRSQNTSVVHTFYFPSTPHIPHAIFIAANNTCTCLSEHSTFSSSENKQQLILDTVHRCA